MRLKSMITSLLVVTSFLVAPISNSSALEIKVAPANWGYIYASGNSVSVQATPRLPSANVEKKSNFLINFNTVPSIARPAVQAAVDIWSENFASTVPVNVNVKWGSSSGYGVLASASAKNNFSNFNGAPDKTLYYASALANALAGRDLDPTSPEIEILITSNAPWYYGTDGNCPARSFDLVSVILHEMGHGLGFVSGNYYDAFSGFGRVDQPTPFDAYAQLPDGRRLADMPSPSLEAGKAMTSDLVWSGENAVKANNGIKPKLYTPSTYEPGSSISHLDEATFSQSVDNAVMTPNLDSGEVFHLPGPLVLAMFEDMRQRPPAGIAAGTPQPPQNVKALIGDKSAIVRFDPPVNFRSAQVSKYDVTNIQTGNVVSVTESPVTISGLKNGTKYTFSVSATNSLGTSNSVNTNSVTPQSAWKSSVVDAAADAKYLATAIYAGKPVIAYSDSKKGDLKLATFSGKKWGVKTIDGNSTALGRTTNDVSGYISMCTSVRGRTNYLHIFYSDLKDKDLRYAVYDGKSWYYEIVDGDALSIQDYKEFPRKRGGSDVSVANACAVTASGVQVFYRDESQGILLGAVKDKLDWRYEIVDGDKDTEDRTTGDVAFHLKATNVGKKIHLIYDSVRGFDMDRNVTRGEMRYASRSSAFVEDWTYKTLDIPGNGVSVAGYDVAIFNGARGINTGWFTGTGASFPNPDQVRYQLFGATSFTDAISVEYGVPNSPIVMDDKTIMFGCQLRLCALNKANRSVTLISNGTVQEGSLSSWITLNKIRYAVAGVSGKLTLFRP
uniref:fibronectin type III domain-containing protein n=2 Tax=Candidatus Nanopelagicus sp. TaxID=2518620 RepID=UPI004049C4E7